ncbi:MAG: hypothetical protein IKE43_05650 [Coriobacteriales bacterium]|nr:hypothetical protein [Coriobacteriales bacterium]
MKPKAQTAKGNRGPQKLLLRSQIEAFCANHTFEMMLPRSPALLTCRFVSAIKTALKPEIASRFVVSN